VKRTPPKFLLQSQEEFGRAITKVDDKRSLNRLFAGELFSAQHIVWNSLIAKAGSHLAPVGWTLPSTNVPAAGSFAGFRKT
jgi:hypothetical protein